jgi:hypothetical protein
MLCKRKVQNLLIIPYRSLLLLGVCLLFSVLQSCAGLLPNHVWQKTGELVSHRRRKPDWGTGEHVHWIDACVAT